MSVRVYVTEDDGSIVPLAFGDGPEVHTGADGVTIDDTLASGHHRTRWVPAWRVVSVEWVTDPADREADEEYGRRFG
jgi:hypothetical protein